MTTLSAAFIQLCYCCITLALYWRYICTSLKHLFQKNCNFFETFQHYFFTTFVMVLHFLITNLFVDHNFLKLTHKSFGFNRLSSNLPTGPIQSLNCNVHEFSVCLSVPLRKPGFPVTNSQQTRAKPGAALQKPLYRLTD